MQDDEVHEDYYMIQHYQLLREHIQLQLVIEEQQGQRQVQLIE